MTSLILANQNLATYIMLGVVAVLLVGMLVYSSRKNKKRQQEAQDLMDAVKPGNKVKTIGGICGIVVEVDNDENTFVLETGSETSGKSYMKFDKQAIYQTDAIVEKDAKKDVKEEDKSDEQESKEEPFVEVTEENKDGKNEDAKDKTQDKSKE